MRNFAVTFCAKTLQLPDETPLSEIVRHIDTSPTGSASTTSRSV
jgi:hypothetical protein